jgi:hypothetical protein
MGGTALDDLVGQTFGGDASSTLSTFQQVMLVQGVRKRFGEPAASIGGAF